ncbi:TonB-dependent receptor [Dokdonella sp.]|uniref:TonB-dependent receptor family protein n=1 Tax=Dokdonella sp. TaxID=2291710 RepID=UPI001B041922|nr:TonB-dependent receptor [Dokdonella sp.]MBO9661802.1 TonB-dependent receptor [Dokdonella sp.]
MRSRFWLTMLGGGFALRAFAADALPTPPKDDLPTVVVTATRSAQDAYEVPASIDAVDVEADSDTLGVNPSEYLGTVPGVLARDRQNYAQDEQISIRGFGARSTFGVRGVRLYVDGIPATMPDGQGQVSHFNLDSAARIEVLRGPFSALYGNSSGGVIQLFTADGSAPPQFDFGLAGASYGTWRASANARGASGGFDYNLDLTHFQTDGYRDHSRAERESGNAKLGWKIGTGGKLTVLLNSVALPGAQDPLGLTRAQFENDPRGVAAVAEQFDTRKSVHQTQGGAIYEQDLGGGHAVRLLGYAGRREVEQYLSVPKSAQGNPLHSGGVVDLGSGYGGTDARWTWRDELAGRPLELAAGLAWDRQRQHRRGYENFVGDALGVRGALRRNEIDTVRDFDQYAQASWRFAEAWTLNLGLRHSQVKFDSADRYVTATNPDDSGKADYGATTPVAGLLWRASEAVHVYAAYGKGFETPTFNELGYRADGRAGLAFDLTPSRTRNGELGLKLRPGAGLEANLAVFRADTRDELAVASAAGGRTTYQNIGKARRDGVEFSLDWRFAERWRLQFAWTRLDATFRSPFATCVGTPCTPTPVAAGTHIPGIPKQNAHLALGWGVERGWRAAFDADAVAAVPVNDLGSDRAPGYAVAGVDLGYGFDLSSGQWRTFLRVDNLFDRRYAGSVIVNDANGRYFEPAPGRTAMLGVRWTWSR